MPVRQPCRIVPHSGMGITAATDECKLEKDARSNSRFNHVSVKRLLTPQQESGNYGNIIPLPPGGSG